MNSAGHARHMLLKEEWDDPTGTSTPGDGNRLTRAVVARADHNDSQVNLELGREPSPSYSIKESDKLTRRMDCLRGSKFAQLLGFGTQRPDDTFPVTMATLDVRDIWAPRQSLPDMDNTSLNTTTSTVGSLEPTFYLSSRGVVDGQWAMNYHEAAIFLEEGENNDMFITHPRRRESLPAYILAHTKWFYILDWLASMVLLILATFEQPAFVQVPIGIHASLELGALTIITFGLVLKMRWLGLHTTLGHQRTLIKGITLLVMFLEAILILARQHSHFRVTRALRPIFLVDNRYLRGVRRFSRQVLQSMPPILDMLILLLFFILMFSLLGNFLFEKDGDPKFFGTAEDSFVNLFVLLTTANYPDVQMPSYYRSRWAVFFFVIYLVTVLYLFMNLLLAVVYEAFTTLEKEKFRKLVIHKQKASNYAFNLLVSKGNPNGVIFRHFHGMMTYLDGDKSLRDIYLSFRALNTTGSGVLSKEEFSKFFEVFNLRWKPQSPLNHKSWTFFRDYGRQLQNLLEKPTTNHVFNFLIVLNGIATLVHCYGQTTQDYWDSYFFAIMFLAEILVKIVAWGPIKFFSSGWNVFDVLASTTFLFCLILSRFLPHWDKFLTFVRPLRLLRLFKLKKRYRNIFGTVFILLPPMVSVAVVILLLYYFFAIIGMEVFSDVELVNCCNGTIFEDYYKNSSDSSQSQVLLRYYLNSFEDIFSSFVTLFELTVVNNWYVIMEGYRYASGSRLSRIYFIIFYLVTMCLLTVVIAFILDTFLFRIRYKREMDKKTEQRMLHREVALSMDEIDFCYSTRHGQEVKKSEILQDYGDDLVTKGYLVYVGSRRRNKEILLKRMFLDEIPNWIRETEPISVPTAGYSRATTI